jgi:hypothetical protein
LAVGAGTGIGVAHRIINYPKKRNDCCPRDQALSLGAKYFSALDFSADYEPAIFAKRGVGENFSSHCKCLLLKIFVKVMVL